MHIAIDDASRVGYAQFLPDEQGDSAAACRALGLVHRFTRPYTPRTNGKAERFIQTAPREWAYARAYHHSSQRIANLPRWLHGTTGTGHIPPWPASHP